MVASRTLRQSLHYARSGRPSRAMPAACRWSLVWKASPGDRVMYPAGLDQDELARRWAEYDRKQAVIKEYGQCWGFACSEPSETEIGLCGACYEAKSGRPVSEATPAVPLSEARFW